MLSELDYALGRLRRKGAADPDGLSNQALQNLPDLSRPWLLARLNFVCNIAEVPETWKTAWVLPVVKSGKPTSRLDSYRPISLISCAAKLMEQMVHHRIVWFLERHTCLPLEITGICEHLLTQDSILDFTNGVEFQLGRGHCVLTVFLDIQLAFDRVRVDAIIDRLIVLGVTHPLTRNLANYLKGWTFFFSKLGSILNSPRSLLVGLPQGSTLTPILFNVAMTDMVPVSPRDGTMISNTMYSDYLCTWAANDEMGPLIKALKNTLDDLTAKLENIGLRIATEKSKFMVQSPPRKYLNEITLTVRSQRQRRFLGIMLGALKE